MEGDSSSVLVSPRPLPVFQQESLINGSTFSQRKKTPFRAPRPPRGPNKSCPPVSRIFRSPNRPTEPRLVSFKSQEKPYTTLSSPHYDSSSKKSYFDQCFVKQEKLGEGSFGEVFRVCSRDDGKMYAIKKSHERFGGEKDRRMKLTEVEKHEELPPHPNCVKFHKAWEERQKLYIQTELCKMSLSEYADLNEVVSEQRIWHILVDLVKGLKHLHDHGLCHLDIKPANIFVGEDNLTCKLGDFGLCKKIEHGFIDDAMEGDARYVAPELMRNQFGKPADVFSLGISMLELACDMELPSGGENWHLLRQGHIPPQLVKDLSPGLVDLLSRMMHPDPKLRPSVDEILGDRCVVLAGYQHLASSICCQFISKCRVVLGRLVAVLTLLLAIFSVRKNDMNHLMVSSSGRRSDVSDDDGGGGGGWRGGGGVGNESFYSDEEEFNESSSTMLQLSEEEDENHVTFNHSWIRHSPVRYPSRIYSGPPIPFDWSMECSPERPHHSSPSNPKHSAGSKTLLFTLERKNLMEAFKDTRSD